MPESLLQILTFCLLLLVWLFLLRVIWAVWAEARAPLTISPPTPATPATTPAPAPAPTRTRPQPDQPLKLKIVEPAAHKGQAFELSAAADDVKIGRSPTNTIALPDDSYVSQLHARIFRRDGGVYLEDLGSTNGTFLNRKPVNGPIALKRGDRIQIGRTVLEVTR
jgi:pSer/pThr/pTyr-binding forkhead associated (FHA) protein